MADIFRAEYDSKTLVAVKRPRMSPQSPKALWIARTVCTICQIMTSLCLAYVTLQAFCREALVWRQLNHSNLVPFIGLDELTWSTTFGIVSTWMPHGTIREYIHSEGYRAIKDREIIVSNEWLNLN
jgi:serine/threonine protein kinase